MPKHDEGAKVFEQVAKPLVGFLSRAVKLIQDAVSKSARKQTATSNKIAASDIEACQNANVSIVSKWREFGTLRRYHDRIPLLKQRVQLLDTHRLEILNFELLLLSCAGRIVYQLHHGASFDGACGEVIAGVRKIIRGDKVETIMGATFPTLELSSRNIVLDEMTAIRRLTDDERRLLDHQFLSSSIGESRESEGPTALVIEYPSKHLESYIESCPVISSDLMKALRPSVAFLQLFANKELKPHKLFVYNKEWVPNPLGRVVRLSSFEEPYPEPQGLLLAFLGKYHKIDDENAQRLRRTWPLFRNAMKKKPQYARACSRFSLSLHRESNEDRLIDHWIALESLFGSESEISRTIATKLAILLSEHLPTRRNYYKWIKTHYSIRSALVHGGCIENRLSDFANAASKTLRIQVPATLEVACVFSGEWLKVSLAQLAEDCGVLDELDDVLLRGSLDRVRSNKIAAPTADELKAARNRS